MTKYTAIQVAQWFLNHVKSLSVGEDVEHLTNLKLQKLLYYAQGASLGLYDRPLFEDPIIHWSHGPAIPDVYCKYSKFRDNPVVEDKDFINIFDRETEELLTDVYSVFGCYSALGLRRRSLEEDPVKNTEFGEVVPNESIKDFFKKEYIC